MKIRDQLTLTFHGHVPSKKNSLRRIRRGGRTFSIASAAHEKWEKEAIAQFRDLRPLAPPYAITARYFLGKLQAFDMSNSQESIHDLLVKVGIITDDNIFALQSFTCELCGLSKGAERVEVTIASLEATDFDAQLNLLRDKEALREHVAIAKRCGSKVTQKSERERLWGALEERAA